MVIVFWGLVYFAKRNSFQLHPVCWKRQDLILFMDENYSTVYMYTFYQKYFNHATFKYFSLCICFSQHCNNESDSRCCSPLTLIRKSSLTQVKSISKFPRQLVIFPCLHCGSPASALWHPGTDLDSSCSFPFSQCHPFHRVSTCCGLRLCSLPPWDQCHCFCTKFVLHILQELCCLHP